MEILKDIIIYGILGFVLYQVVLFLLPRVAAGRYINWLNNWRFRRLIKKMEDLIKADDTSEKKESRDKYGITKHKEYIQSRYEELSNFKDTHLKYVTLLERYKFDKQIWKQLLVDWDDYVELLNDYIWGYKAIVESGVMIQDFEDREKDNARMYEIEKRFKELMKAESKEERK